MMTWTQYRPIELWLSFNSQSLASDDPVLIQNLGRQLTVVAFGFDFVVTITDDPIWVFKSVNLDRVMPRLE